MKKTGSRSPLLAAAFLMATSAIGPGFLTQTAVFTSRLKASFGFIILCSVLLDLGAQLNIWRVLSVTGLRGQELGNRLMPGLGHVLTVMIVAGGLAFNIGNLAGAGLGLNVLTGLSPESGAAISAGIAIFIFLLRDALQWMDVFAKALGLVMIALVLYVVFQSRPPLGQAALRFIMPEQVDYRAILTLVGGTVGGYISFAGAHRLLDAGAIGAAARATVDRSAFSAILLASLMRVLLFLAALGVVSKGFELAANNPAASVFQFASGAYGYKIFGIVMWSAAITSVIGSTYTSLSFLQSLNGAIGRNRPIIKVAFILLSLFIFWWVGQPVRTLVFVGLLNAFVLPLALGMVLTAAHRPSMVGAYRHPVWMTVLGAMVLAATLWFGVSAILTQFN
jgi:Mn2+/Fe2+ NRAMP family transporter